MVLSEDELARVQSALLKLIDDIEPNSLCTFIQSKHIFSDDDVERIVNKPTRRERANEFLNIYKRKAENLDALKEALEREHQTHLIDLLDSPSTSTTTSTKRQPPPFDRFPSIDSNYLRVQLNKGGVPGRLHVHVDRMHHLHTVMSALVEHSNQDRFYIVIVGMVGAGKSTLCADVFRAHPELISAHYFLEIFWISKGGDANGNESTATTFTLLNNLYMKLTHNYATNIGGAPIESLINQVVCEIVDNHPRMLLVLDDVADDDVVRVFDQLPCRILATSRNRSLFNVARRSVHIVEMDNSSIGFSRDESMHIMAQHCKCSIDRLPSQADLVHRLCCGHPLVVNLIGALLQRHPDRWQTYCDDLRSYRLNAIDIRSVYHHSNVELAIGASYAQLDQTHRNAFSLLVAFPIGANIPDTVLSIIWPNQTTTYLLHCVQNVMIELAACSLVYHHVNDKCIDQRRLHSFSMHPLVYAFAKKITTSLLIMELRRLFVSTVEQQLLMTTNTRIDERIEQFFYEHLGYLLYGAKLFDNNKFAHYFHHLDQLIRRLQWTSPAMILVELRIYRQWISQLDTTETTSEICKFLQKYSAIISRRDVDVLQLALCEPTTSSIHHQALELTNCSPISLFRYVSLSNEIQSMVNLQIAININILHSFIIDEHYFIVCLLRQIMIIEICTGHIIDRIDLASDVDRIATANRLVTVKLKDDGRMVIFDFASITQPQLIDNAPALNDLCDSPYFCQTTRPTQYYLSIESKSFDCTLSPNGNRLAVIGENCVSIYDLSNRRPIVADLFIQNIGANSKIVFINETQLVIGDDGQFILIDNFVEICKFDMHNSTSLHTFIGANDRLICITEHPSGIFCRLFGNSRHMDMETSTTSLSTSISSPSAISLCAVSMICAIGLIDRTIRLFNVASELYAPRCIRIIGCDRLKTLHITENKLIASTDNQRITIWNTDNLMENNVVSVTATALNYSPKTQQLIAIAALDNSTYVMHRGSDEEVGQLPVGVVTIAISTDHRTIVFGSIEATLLVYNANNMKEAHIEFTIDSSPKQLVICADGQYIAALLDDGRIALVTMQNRSIVYSTNTCPYTCIQSVELGLLLTADESAIIRMYRLPTTTFQETDQIYRPQMDICDGRRRLTSIVHLDHNQLICAIDNRHIYLVDMEQQPRSIGNEEEHQQLTLSPCGQYLLTWSSSGNVTIYDRHRHWSIIGRLLMIQQPLLITSTSRCDKLFAMWIGTNGRVQLDVYQRVNCYKQSSMDGDHQ